MKNTFAPISRIPSELFALIPGYWGGEDMGGEECVDKNLITMTHVCRGWRKLLTACPPLWARLDCTNADKTRVYIERSKSSPLELEVELFLYNFADTTFPWDAFLLVVPHTGRLRSLTINITYNTLQKLAPHFSSPIPLLRELTINLIGESTPLFDALFNGDLSSLRSLSLSGVVTHLPWKGMSKLTSFKLCHDPRDTISVTRLLDFFENAHHLTDITLKHSIPTSSNAPPDRVISLPCLKNLSIFANPAHSILLNHLSIPVGASLALDFEFTGLESPLLEFLPNSLENLGNILSISSVNLFHDGFEKYVRLDGPSGGLCMLGHRSDQDVDSWFVLDRRLLRSLTCFNLSGAQTLAITGYQSPTPKNVDKSAPYHLLSHMNDLRTIALTRCNNLPFILALDPGKSPSRSALCPKLEKLILYVGGLESFNLEELRGMAKQRVLVGAKLSSIAIIGRDELAPGREVSKLKEYVARVDYRVEEGPPRWDCISEDWANSSSGDSLSVE